MRYREYHNKRLQEDPEYKKEYDALGPEFEVIRMLIKARESEGFTQKDLEAITGINQATISKIETGAREPGIRCLQKIAQALGYTLSISPISTAE